MKSFWKGSKIPSTKLWLRRFVLVLGLSVALFLSARVAIYLTIRPSTVPSFRAPLFDNTDSVLVGSDVMPSTQQRLEQMSSSEKKKLINGAKDTYVWPNTLVGLTWASPFVHISDPPYDLKGSPKCAGIIPQAAYDFVPPWNGTEFTLQELRESNKRVLIWFPRFGMGNSLRAFVSSYIFSMLSGRHLLVWNGGPHKQVIRQLCEAFHCGFDQFVYEGDFRRVGATHILINDRPHRLLASAADEKPLVFASTGKFFDQFWNRDRTSLQCVYGALHCSSQWCVRSRALSALLGGGPTDALGTAVEDMLQLAVPTQGPASAEGEAAEGTLMEGEEKAMAEDTPAGTAAGEEQSSFKLQPGTGGRLQFDVAIHVRTRTVLLEVSKHLLNCSANDKACQKTAKKWGVQDEEERLLRYTSKFNWLCVAEHMRELKKKKVERVLARRAIITSSDAAEAATDATAEAGVPAEAPLGAEEEAAAAAVKVHQAENSEFERALSAQPPLNIFLATDNERLRPLFVNFLSGTGNIFFSTGHVIHTSKGGRGKDFLPTMAEFYLMSKAATLIEFERVMSTFALFSGLLGNITLLTFEPHNSTCHFRTHHRSRPSPTVLLMETMKILQQQQDSSNLLSIGEKPAGNNQGSGI